MESSGLGRGRGRGRRPTQDERSPPATPPQVASPESPPRDAEQEFERMYMQDADSGGTSQAGSVVERTRVRGRGMGRGRMSEVPQVDTAREMEEAMNAMKMQQQETERQEAEIAARYAEDVIPQQEAEVHTPPSEIVGPTTPPQEKVMPVQIEKDQKESITSQGLPSSLSSRRKPEQEEEVISMIGTKGEAVELKTNYLRLKLLQDHPGVVEYHVSMDPNIDEVRKRRKLLSTEACLEKLGSVRSFDGMVLFLPQILPNDVTVIHTHLENEPEVTYKVQVTFEKVKLMKDAIIFFNILLHRIMRELKYQELKREYFDLTMITALNQHKLEIWPGLALTSENQEDGLMICVDTCSRVLRQDTVFDFLRSIVGDPQMKKKFDDFIINKIVMTKYNYKCYKIDEVMWDQQPNSTFIFREKEISYIDYLKDRYPLANEITDLNQPMLISKIKPRKNDKFAAEGKVAALVPQLCYITGLTEDQKANYKVMTDLAASTKLGPAQRLANLNSFVSRLLGNKAVEEILNNWGLRIEKNVIEVRGRRVDGPNLEFSKRIQLQKAPPDFSREAGKGVYDPVDIKNYVLLCTQRDSDKAKRFMDTYKEVATPLGIRTIQAGRIIYLKGMRPSDFSEALRTNCNPDTVHFVVVIMPMQRDDVYSAIKRHCVATSPIPSQCIVSKTLGNEKRLRSIVLKIALQINCKLGGSLWALKMPLKDEIMFIGIDAAHDPLKKDPSVICLVASLNNECTKYFSKSATSKIHMELGENLGAMTTEALKEYRELRGLYPNRIVVFRDGGSLGALETIETTEMDQMKKAATRVCGDELKNFTFALVTKRISQRFFAKTGREKLDNPQPGTIVDNTVTRRHLYDFYVVSQQVREGTVNPTHFVVVDKKDPIRPDLIHRLAYVTCFMYYNWSGTVRVPAPVQYAHKLSALLIKHVKAAPHRDISNTLYYL